MSGGHFDYQQYKLEEIANSIEQQILNNNVKNTYGDSEYSDCNNYSDKTLYRFKQCVEMLKTAQIYVQRIDYLLSGDDGEESFHVRLENELSELNKNKL